MALAAQVPLPELAPLAAILFSIELLGLRVRAQTRCRCALKARPEEVAQLPVVAAVQRVVCRQVAGSVFQAVMAALEILPETMAAAAAAQPALMELAETAELGLVMLMAAVEAEVALMAVFPLRVWLRLLP